MMTHAVFVHEGHDVVGVCSDARDVSRRRHPAPNSDARLEASAAALRDDG